MKIDYSIFSQKTSIDRFIFALENEYFIEGHELLEDEWRELKKQGLKKEALVLKAFINASTAFALYYKKQKIDAYKKVWPVFNKYINFLDEIHLEEKEKFYKAKELIYNINNQIGLELKL